MKHRYKSLKQQMLVRILVPVIFLISFLLYYSFYSVHIYQEEISHSHQAMIDLYAHNIEEMMVETDYFLTEVVANNKEFMLIRKPVTQLQAHLALDTLKNICELQLASNRMVERFMVYSVANNSYRQAFSTKYAYEQNNAIRVYAERMAQAGEAYAERGWFHEVIGEKDYLVRIIGNDGAYMIAWVDFASIPLPTSSRLGEESFIVFVNEEGQALTQKERVVADGIQFVEPSIKMMGRRMDYLLIGRPITGSDVALYLVKENNYLMKGLSKMHLFLFVVSILTICLIPMSIYSIRKALSRPIDQLRRVMERIQGGELDAQVEGSYAIQEFEEINDTFNSMIKKIKDLKIEAYELEIDKQKAQLQYLQLQLQPHFFLNCLKNIYGMAQSQKYEKIQELILSISKHLRYIFKDNTKLVSLSEELEYVKNYLLIQTIGGRNVPECMLDVAAQTMGYSVPPLVIQTFVENSVKHAGQESKGLQITIKVRVLQTDEGKYLDIIIADNGGGYPEEMLAKLANEQFHLCSDEHVGISNIIHRLRLLYQGRVEFAFMNSNEGAYSEMIIPIE